MPGCHPASARALAGSSRVTGKGSWISGKTTSPPKPSSLEPERALFTCSPLGPTRGRSGPASGLPAGHPCGSDPSWGEGGGQGAVPLQFVNGGDEGNSEATESAAALIPLCLWRELGSEKQARQRQVSQSVSALSALVAPVRWRASVVCFLSFTRIDAPGESYAVEKVGDSYHSPISREVVCSRKKALESRGQCECPWDWHAWRAWGPKECCAGEGCPKVAGAGPTRTRGEGGRGQPCRVTRVTRRPSTCPQLYSLLCEIHFVKGHLTYVIG